MLSATSHWILYTSTLQQYGVWSNNQTAVRFAYIRAAAYKRRRTKYTHIGTQYEVYVRNAMQYRVLYIYKIHTHIKLHSAPAHRLNATEKVEMVAEQRHNLSFCC